jgi:hypothetical protein
MNPTARNLLLVILMLFVALSPMVMGNFGLEDEDDHPGDNDLLVMSILPMTWINKILVHRIPDLLRFGISFFALFLVFLGGRSKAKRFNDRTLDSIKPLVVLFSKAALFIRAAFNFCVLAPNRVLQTVSCSGFFVYPRFYFPRR